MNIQKELEKLSDEKYRDFQSKLMPTVPKEKVLGIRMPVLKSFAKSLKGTKEAEKFLNTLPHKYYDEYNLHALLIDHIKDFDKLIEKIQEFLPYVDNWATCDMCSPALFAKNKEKLLVLADKWISSDAEYTVRFGIGIYMKHFLDNNFKEEYLKKISQIKSEKYYINMMIAWYFATAIAKQYEFAVKYLEDNILSKWVHNKTISKAVESCRVTDEHKEYLKTLRVK